MKAKPLVPRVLARQDVDQAIAYDLAEDAPQAAIRFVGALEAAYAHIAKSPVAGSPRYAQELDIPGLRSWLLARCPFRVFTLSCPHPSTFGACCTPAETSPALCKNPRATEANLAEVDMNEAITPFEPTRCAAACELWERTPGVGLSEADECQAIAQFLGRNPGLIHHLAVASESWL